MKHPIFLIIAFILLGLIYQPVLAQVDSVDQKKEKINDLLKEMKNEMQSNHFISDSIISPPAEVQGQLLDDSTMANYRKAINAYYKYRVSGFEHRKRVFGWQLFSSKLIFWCVLGLVFSGICFSGVQFYKSINREQIEGAVVAESVTEFEASAQGIKISSPVLGVIILVISLVFFYLYLLYVYPIREIF